MNERKLVCTRVDEDTVVFTANFSEYAVIATVMFNGDISYSAWKPCDGDTEYWCKMEIGERLHGRVGTELEDAQDAFEAIQQVLPPTMIEYNDIFQVPSSPQLVLTRYTHPTTLVDDINRLEDLPDSWMMQHYNEEVSHEKVVA